MSGLFARKKSTRPDELVASTVEAVSAERGADGAYEPKRLAEIARCLGQMKLTLYGDGEARADPDAALELAREVWRQDLLALLVANLQHFEFETRKDVSQVFSNLLRRQSGGVLGTVAWLEAHPETLLALLRGYESPGVALNTGLMLRESLRHERLARLLLPESGEKPVYQLFTYVESPYFDVASDAFAAFKDLLTKHKQLVAAFLLADFDVFFGSHYQQLLASENYVTRRQSLKLLGELLLDRSNFAVMTRYIASAEHLKTVMILLREKASSIQYEAFHVFKIFVANPHKDDGVRAVLLRNRQKLLEFMATFQSERADEQFVEEKEFLINEIANLQPAPSEPAAASREASSEGEEAGR